MNSIIYLKNVDFTFAFIVDLGKINLYVEFKYNLYLYQYLIYFYNC